MFHLALINIELIVFVHKKKQKCISACIVWQPAKPQLKQKKNCLKYKKIIMYWNSSRVYVFALYHDTIDTKVHDD